MNKTVSIIIPAYNSEKWIAGCIESAKRQTYKKTEIIVIDDGSKDSTLSIANHFASSSIKVVGLNENHGASAARNEGLRIAQGEYIQWLDADDLLGTRKIETQIKALYTLNDSSILFSGSWAIFKQNPLEAIFNNDKLCHDLSPYQWLLYKIERNLWMPPMVFLVSRELSESAGPWNETLMRDNDGEYFCRVIANTSSIKYIPESKCYKRTTFGISHSSTISDKKLNSIAYSLFYYITTIRNINDSERTRRACLKLLNRWSI